MSDSGRTAQRSWTPWLIAVIAGVVFVAGIIVYCVAAEATPRSDDTAGQFFSATQKAAMTAAAVEATNLLTFSLGPSSTPTSRVRCERHHRQR